MRKTPFGIVGSLRYLLNWIMGALVVMMILMAHDGTPLRQLFDLVCILGVAALLDAVCAQLQQKGYR